MKKKNDSWKGIHSLCWVHWVSVIKMSYLQFGKPTLRFTVIRLSNSQNKLNLISRESFRMRKRLWLFHVLFFNRFFLENLQTQHLNDNSYLWMHLKSVPYSILTRFTTHSNSPLQWNHKSIKSLKSGYCLRLMKQCCPWVW